MIISFFESLKFFSILIVVTPRTSVLRLFLPSGAKYELGFALGWLEFEGYKILGKAVGFLGSFLAVTTLFFFFKHAV